MTIDDTADVTVPAGSLAVHRVGPDGSPTERIAVARPVTSSAALIEPEADDTTDPTGFLDHRPVPPALPLVLVDDAGVAVPVLEVHTSDRSPSIALETEEPVLSVVPSDDDEPDPLPGRSVWCTIFPRMRGC
jgi:hypothetical protein